MVDYLDQTEGKTAGHLQNSDLQAQEGALNGSLRSHAATEIEADLLASDVVSTFKNEEAKGLIDGVNTEFTMKSLPDSGTLTGYLITSAATVSLVEDRHFTRSGKNVVMSTPPAPGSVVLFSGAETQESGRMKTVPHRLEKVPKKIIMLDNNGLAKVRVVAATNKEITLQADNNTKVRYFLEA